MSRFTGWFGEAAHQPLGALWMGLEVVLLVLGILAQGWVVWRASRDLLHLGRLGREGPADRKALLAFSDCGGVVGRAVAMVLTRGPSGLAVSPEHYAGVVADHYEGATRMTIWARSSATLVGLLFTFVGLGLGLHDLKDAIVLDKGVGTGGSGGGASVPPIYTDLVSSVLDEIGQVLPSLSLAFASSIAGVVVSLMLAVFSLFGDWLIGTVGFLLSRHGAVILEPAARVRDGIRGLVVSIDSMLEQQRMDASASRECLARLEVALQENTLAAREAVARDLRLSGTLDALTIAVDGLPSRLEEVVGGALSKAAGDVTSAAESLVTASASAGETLKECATGAGASLELGATKGADRLEAGGQHAGELLGCTARGAAKEISETLLSSSKNLNETLTGSGAQWAKLTESALRTSTLLQEAIEAILRTAVFTESSIGAVTRGLDISRDHLDGLKVASERFVMALDATTVVVTRAENQQSAVLRDVRETLSSIAPMTEQVAMVSQAAEQAAVTMHEAFSGDRIRAYMDALPALVAVADGQRAAIEELIAAASVLRQLGQTVKSLDHRVIDFGRSVQAYQRLYEQVELSTRILSEGQLSPAIAAIVRGVTQAEMEALQDTLEPVIRGHGDQMVLAMARIGASLERLDQLQVRMDHWLRQPGWRRLLSGAGEQ